MMFNLFDDVVIEIVSSDMFSNKSYHSLALIKGSHVSLPHEPCDIPCHRDSVTCYSNCLQLI